MNHPFRFAAVIKIPQFAFSNDMARSTAFQHDKKNRRLFPVRDYGGSSVVGRKNADAWAIGGSWLPEMATRNAYDRHGVPGHIKKFNAVAILDPRNAMPLYNGTDVAGQEAFLG